MLARQVNVPRLVVFLNKCDMEMCIRDRYYEDIKKVEVSLKVVKPEVAANKEAGIKILIPNGEFYASKVCDTFEEAIDLDVEALEKQLVKYKEKQRSK